jgi:hypothetical protein
MHMASRKLPQVAMAFEEFLRGKAQTQILQQLGTPTLAPVPVPRHRAASAPRQCARPARASRS